MMRIHNITNITVIITLVVECHESTSLPEPSVIVYLNDNGCFIQKTWTDYFSMLSKVSPNTLQSYTSKSQRITVSINFYSLLRSFKFGDLREQEYR